MDRLQAMTVFVAVAEEQGFVAASRRLALSAPAVTRAVASLEERLGTPLLVRTTRRVRLTEAGQQFLQDARRILADLEAAEESVTGIHGNPAGHLVVTAPVMFGRLYVMPVITDYLKRYESVTLSSIFVDRVTSLVDEGIDVGIRIGDLPDSSLRAVRLGSISLKTYASPDYIRQFGAPQTPEELHQHRLIASVTTRPGLIWRYRHQQGGKQQDITVKIHPHLTTTTNDSAIAAAVDGFGIARVLSYQTAPQVEAGELVPVLEAFDGPPIPVNIVHAQGRNLPAKVRTFIDMARDKLRVMPVFNPESAD